MKHARLILTFAAALVLAGCVNLGKNIPDRVYYNLDAVRKPEAGPPAEDVVLRVRRVRVSPRYSGRELVYKTGPERFESDFYNLFFILPADMFTQDVREWLNDSKAVAHAIDPSSLIRPGLTLEGAVNAMYGDFSSSPPKAVLTMQFILLDENSPTQNILFFKNYDKSIPLAQATPAGLVEGLNKALGEILTEMESDLRTALEQRYR